MSGYTPTIWNDGEAPAISAANLNKVETGVMYSEGVDSLADLKALPVPTFAQRCWVRGHTTVSDGGEGPFDWDATCTDADDDGITVLPTGYVGIGRWVRSYVGPVYVDWYGMQTDADETLTIQKTLDYCTTNGKLIAANSGSYAISSTLIMDCSGDLSRLELLVDNAVDIAVETGRRGGYLRNMSIHYPTVLLQGITAGAWRADTIGILIGSVIESDIYFNRVRYFASGVRLAGLNNDGFAYNRVYINILYDNQINLQLKTIEDAWVNQNVFLGGRLAFDSSVSNWTGTTHIQFAEASNNPTKNPPNNNLFLNTSIECPGPLEWMLDIQGASNTFLQCRYESQVNVRPVRIYSRTTNQSSRNLFIGGVNVEKITYTFEGASSISNGTIGADGLKIDSASVPFIISNRFSNSSSGPHMLGFTIDNNVLEKDSTSTDWVYRLWAGGMDFKSSTDTDPKISLKASDRSVNANLYKAADVPGITQEVTIDGTTLSISGGIITGVS